MLNKEKLFYDTLRDLFIGVEVEGQGGYIKLMKIKKKYYEKLEEELKESIEQALFKYPDFREELFDKLYSFFKRYFTESGAIYFNSTPFHNNVYEKVYTDEKDVVLFWKTHMLYYVKTDRVFRSMNVEVDGYKFFFDVSELQPKRNNEKRELIYELSEVKEDGTIHIKVKYSERGKETKTEEILKELKKNYKKLSEEVLEKAFRTFEKQSEVDYFINKNAREFLREQFKLWLYQYYFDNEGEFTKERVDQLNILKNIAYKIIDFISQFEDEILKIWRKPKFVLNSNYVITLDRIVDKGEKGYVILEKILNHPNFEKQLQEWKELGIVDESFRKEEIIKRDLTGRYLNPKFKFLPVDTKYFKDLELDILSLFENLDNELDGWLIKSENWQALNTILPKFRGRIKTIYIDPPYNTGSDGFLYKDRYQHSTWLTMMENRLSLARELMSEDGVIFVSIDDNEVDNLLKLLKEKFSLVIPLHWRRNKTPQLASKTVATRMEFVLYGAMQEIKLIRERQSKVRPLFNFDGREYRIFEIPEGIIVKCDKLSKGKIYAKRNKKNWIEILDDPIINQGVLMNKIRIKGPWRKIDEELQKVFKNKLIFINSSGFPTEILDEEDAGVPVVKTNELIIEGCYNETAFEELTQKIFTFSSELVGRLRPKPTCLITHLLNSVSTLRKNSIILDFFAGSGTTAHAVMKLNKEDGGKRKFILVEMADYFDTVIIPRIKKVAYSFNWKDGKPQDNDGIGVFCKYYELEQYEQALANTVYEDNDIFTAGKNLYERYLFLKDEKMLRALEIDCENNKVRVNLSKLYPNIDIAETLSNLKGKWIKRIEKDKVIFEDGEEINIQDLDYKHIKPLIWWE